MFSTLAADLLVSLGNGKLTFSSWFRKWYAWIVAIGITIFTASIVADVMGYNGLQLVFAIVGMLAIAFVMGYVGLVVEALKLALESSRKIRDGKRRQALLESLEKSWGEWKQFFLHAALFGSVFFLTRFMFPIKANPKMGIIAVVALAMVGLMVWAYKTPAVYYKKYIKFLAVASLAVVFIGLFWPETTKKAPPGTSPIVTATPVVKSIAKSAVKAVKGVFTDEWQAYRNVTCPVQWNGRQGWCKIDVPPGSYRVIPQYDTWELGLDNGRSLPIPPRGVSLVDNWGNSPALVDEFRRTAPLGHSQMVGSLVVKKGSVIVDPLQQEKMVLESGESLAVGVNLPPKEAYYRLTRAELRVNIEKLVE